MPKKRIYAVEIRGKYVVPKSALFDFSVGDFANLFRIECNLAH